MYEGVGSNGGKYKAKPTQSFIDRTNSLTHTKPKSAAKPNQSFRDRTYDLTHTKPRSTKPPYVAPKKVVAKKPVNHAPAIIRKQAPKPPPRPAYTASRTPAYSSGKTVGSNKTGRITAIAPIKPKPLMTGKPQIAPKPALPTYEDDAYMQQTADAQNAMRDYLTNMGSQQNNYDIEYTRNVGDANDQNVKDKNYTSEDFASRGGIQSGSYLNGMAEQTDKLAKQQSALSGGRAAYSSNMQSALQNFRSQQGVEAGKYKLDAIARRALKYNLA